MITERCRMSMTDTVLIFLAAFVLVSTVMGSRVPLQTVIVSPDGSHHATYAVPWNHRDLPSIRNRLESYGEATDHPLLATNRWIAEASRFYVNAAEPLWQHYQPASVHSSVNLSVNSPKSTIQQVSHQTSAQASAGLHEPAARSWQRIATEAEARIAQIQDHQAEQLQSLVPAPVKLGGTVNVYWTRSSLITAMVVASLVLLMVSVWKRVCPTRQFQPLSVSRETVLGIDHQWIAMEVLPEWIRLHQTNGAILRRSFVAFLVLSAFISLCMSFTSLA